jgi:hypothetical protein
MELMRERWTDERLDDLNAKVDDLARRMDLRFDAVDRRFETLERRIDRMYWFMTTGFVTLAALIVERT